MSSEILSSDYMVSASGKTPWHGLGAVWQGTPTAAEALAAAKLNWTVNQEPIYDGDMKTVASHQLNRRSDTGEVLGVVQQGWEPVQNDRLLEIAESLAQVDGMEYQPVIETAGSLRGGRIVWALVRTGERQFGDSLHRSYLLLSNGHDGKRAVRGTLTDVRVVCANTLRLAESAVSGLYVCHARGVETRIKNAIATLGWANDATRATFAIYEALATTKVTVDAARATFRQLVIGESEEITPAEERAIERMTHLFRHGSGNAGETAFDVLNAVTDWADHDKGYRQDDGTAERRFIASSLGGDTDRLKTEAFRAVRSLIAA